MKNQHKDALDRINYYGTGDGSEPKAPVGSASMLEFRRAKQARRRASWKKHLCYHCLVQMHPKGENWYCPKCGSLECEQGEPAKTDGETSG